MFVIVAEELFEVEVFCARLCLGRIVAGEGADVAAGAMRTDEPPVYALLKDVHEVTAR